MAFPFAQMPTLSEFMAIAANHGCKRVQIPGTIVGPRGEIDPTCLQGPSGVPVVLPDIAPDEPLTPTVLSNLCRRLGLDPAIYQINHDPH